MSGNLAAQLCHGHTGIGSEGRSRPSNKRMQLTKLRAAPVWQAEVPPCAPAGQRDGGTASQLIRGVRQTFLATEVRLRVPGSATDAWPRTFDKDGRLRTYPDRTDMATKDC